jgi:UDP-2-acetamido-2,6-beta-L-arabino-hexul-4-ose reductase
MLKIGITGQAGFVGTHLFNTLGLFPEEFERVPFKKEYFSNQQQLEQFISQCNVIVHLAAMNRHNDTQVIYKTNIELVQKLVDALEATHSNAHVVFSSSTQEEKLNEYGKSKKDGRELLYNWALKKRTKFTGLIIPNVFGPFGNPFYNSFISTFSYQLTNNIQPKIEVDSAIKLIYVGDLVDKIISTIRSGNSSQELLINSTDERKVSSILDLLIKFKKQYFDNGIIPKFDDKFDLNLFNTFRSYINLKTHFPIYYKQHSDERGSFTELIRLESGGQVSFSTTLPNITRGNHFHTRKIERFSVIKGKALIQIKKIGTSEIIELELDGNKPAYVDIPIWCIHNITNIGDDILYTCFWINEPYNPDDPDTYFKTI